MRLVGAVLAEQTDEWAEGRRYLGLEVLARCRLTSRRDHRRRGEHRPRPRPRTQRLRPLSEGSNRYTTTRDLTYAAFTLLVIDEWLLDHPDESMRSMLLELLERRYDSTSTVFCTQYAKKDWHQRLGSGVHADAIMDRIVHNTIWVDTGTHNMREKAILNQ